MHQRKGVCVCPNVPLKRWVSLRCRFQERAIYHSTAGNLCRNKATLLFLIFFRFFFFRLVPCFCLASLILRWFVIYARWYLRNRGKRHVVSLFILFLSDIPKKKKKNKQPRVFFFFPLLFFFFLPSVFLRRFLTATCFSSVCVFLSFFFLLSSSLVFFFFHFFHFSVFFASFSGAWEFSTPS